MEYLRIIAIFLLIYLIWRSLSFVFAKTGGNEGSIAKTSPSLPYFYVVRTLLWLFFRIYNRLTVQGHENLPQKGPFLVVANHSSIFDGGIIGVAMRLPIYIMVKKEAFERPIMGFILRKILTFPVDRNKADPKAIKTALKVLIDGKILGIFPEGTRNLKGLVKPFKPGAIRFAVKQNVPVVPAFIWNSHLLTPNGSSLLRPVKMKVEFGALVDVPAMIKEGKREDEIQQLVYERVCELGEKVAGYSVKDQNPDVEVAENQ